MAIGYERPEDERKVSVCMENGELRPKWVSHRWYRKLPYYYDSKARGNKTGGKKGKPKALGQSSWRIFGMSLPN